MNDSDSLLIAHLHLQYRAGSLTPTRLVQRLSADKQRVMDAQRTLLESRYNLQPRLEQAVIATVEESQLAPSCAASL